MLCDQMFLTFNHYFTFAYTFGFFPFKWEERKDREKRKRYFLSIRFSDWQFILWILNNLILFLKNVFLACQVYVLTVEKNMSKVVFENLFLFSFTIGFIHNVIYWKTRKSFPVLYKRCTTFCNLAHVRYLPHTNRRYPLEDDGLNGMMKMASCINVVFTVCVFLLSMGTPTAHPFFANLLPPSIFMGGWGIARFGFSIFEAYITAFAWTSNTSIVLLLPNFALLLKFWAWELHANSPPTQLSKNFSRLRELDETVKTYRQLQLLTTQLNECFAAQVENLFMLAFINQVSVNYGTLRLYNELSIQAWVACARQRLEQVCTPNRPPPLQLTGPFSTCFDSVKEGLSRRHSDQNKDTPQVLQKYDYPFETYNVITKDGYILTVYRITGSPKLRKKSKRVKQAVYLNHGLGGASNTWNFQPKSRNLPFKLADAGYEVWLANGRGTALSLKHTKYSSVTDLRYWNFSFHEMGMYDVPAVTNKILLETNARKIFYVGHSQGTTQYFVGLSELPEMNDKIAAAFLLAPVAYMGHVKSDHPIRLLAPLLSKHPQYRPANSTLVGTIESTYHIHHRLKNSSPDNLCDPTSRKCGVCDNLMFLLFGYDAWQLNTTELPNIIAKYPNNIPMKCLAHYSQNIVNCKFQKYDYGRAGNGEVYGNEEAPEYQLRNIKVPTYFFYGEQDTLAPPNDVQITASKMKFGVLKVLFTDAQLIKPTPDNVCAPNPPNPLKLSGPFSTCAASVKSSLGQPHPDQNKLTPQILATYNYKYISYNVTTNDGYILTVYRITESPKRTRSRSKGAKQSVYLNHGLGGSSDTWNFQPGSRNLPFKLADAGYDVWLSNCRGTTYSMGHKNYDANKDIAYWSFSFHEMGIYDVPAGVDKILNETGTKKVFYIGHSMGTTQYFIALSEVPGLNDKIEAGFMLAPIAYMGHLNSAIRLLVPLLATDPEYQIANLALMGRVQTLDQFRQQFKLSPGDLCDLTATKCGICDNLIFLLFGYNAPQMNNTELPNILAKYPNNIGVKWIAHYAQNIVTCRFQKYDYGPVKNMELYKSAKSPEYNLQNITAPTYFFYGEQDNLGPPNDVQITAKNMRPGVLKGNYKVRNKFFNHVDFVTAKDADKLVYNRILSEMKRYKPK
ncbi:Lipase 3 [Orchesella cincta]|uniref:Lipase 3 n=1 Tax=Orchesella cincta TaxID=48709 RepID=A0A1D2MKZ1_ORCCI|nr:Lipase 3 [Orchesella cincta]